MLAVNFDKSTETMLKGLAQQEEKSIEQVLIDALNLYQENEKIENEMLNELANSRLHDGQALIRVYLDNL